MRSLKETVTIVKIQLKLLDDSHCICVTKASLTDAQKSTEVSTVGHQKKPTSVSQNMGNKVEWISHSLIPEVSRNLRITILSLLVLQVELTNFILSMRMFTQQIPLTQNATQTLLMRYSRGVLIESYNPTIVVILTECCKFLLCLFIILFGYGESGLSQNEPIITKIIYLIRHSGYSWIPATCYFLQNSLLYVASENLTSSVYAVLQQMKIVSAALISVCILDRKLSWKQWKALILLSAGGLLMECHTFSLYDKGALLNNNDPIQGTAAIFTIVGLSGFSGVMTELLLKNKELNSDAIVQHTNSLSIWDRNIQLSFWSIIFGIISLFINRAWMYKKEGLFSGFSVITLWLICIFTVRSLLVALTLKYTNVMIKECTSTISLILICLGGNIFLNDYLDLLFGIGAMITIIAIFNYNDKEGVNMPSSPISTSMDPCCKEDDVVMLDDSELQLWRNTTE